MIKAIFRVNGNHFEAVTEFLKYCKTFYGEEFVVVSVMMNSVMMDSNTIEYLCDEDIFIDVKLKLINFILDEFGQQININLLYYSFEHADYELFEYLMNKYPHQSKLEYICNGLRNAASKYNMHFEAVAEFMRK